MRAKRKAVGVAAFLAGCVVTALALKTDLPQRLLPVSAKAERDLYAPRDWNRSAPSKLNISSFAFADRNRSGAYDPGDRPMAGVAVRLTRPDGSTVIGRSNVNGFANFAMQLGGEEGDITVLNQPYRFELIPPPGWEITTGNAVHDTSFRAVPGAIAGMGAVDPPPVVGLAPAPTLLGRWPDLANRSLVVTSDAGEKRRMGLDSSGRFEVSLSPGTWSLPAPERAPRRVQVGFAPVYVSQGSGFGAAAEPGGPERIVDFDDVDRSYIEKLAPGYAGLGWDYLLAVDNQFYEGPGYVNGLVSGAMVAYNSSGHPATLYALAPGGHFDFLGGYFATAWPQSEGEVVTARAFRDGRLVAEDRLTLSHLGPVYFQADYLGVSRVEFTTEHYWQFVVDDLRVRTP